MGVRYWLLVAAVFPTANAAIFWALILAANFEGRLAMLASGLAAGAEVYILRRIAPTRPLLARAVGAIVIVTLTGFGLVVYVGLRLRWVDCPPDAYECPL